MGFDELFQRLSEIISSKSFLQNDGSRAAIPSYICAFEPSRASELDDHVKTLCSKLKSVGVDAATVNLYDLCIKILREEEIFDQILDEESDYDKEDLELTLSGVLSPSGVLKEKFQELASASEPPQVLFITGVGECYPFLRAQSLLANLEHVTDKIPTVLFFPGTYTITPGSAASLELFGRLPNDRYYRAGNILDFPV